MVLENELPVLQHVLEELRRVAVRKGREFREDDEVNLRG
jgi:hypothetical protein